MSAKRSVSDEPGADLPLRRHQEALGQSEAFLEFQERLPRVAKVDRPVLIVGERGTGKELAVRRLHYLSRRWERPLVALNCAALAPSLVESELFGHEAGAFTGAARRRRGRFEAADGGTLFLDEIANIPVEVQEKILRVVEYGVFERVGGPLHGEGPVTVDARIVGATNADLSRLAETGSFRRDLLDRLSFEVLFLPPLRARSGDVMLLANHFAARMAHELGRLGPGEIPQFTDRAARTLTAYSWPGNVRELKNVIERAVYRSDSASVHEIVFDPFQPSGDTKRSFSCPQTPAAPRARAPEEEDAKREGTVPFTEAVRNLEIRLLGGALADARYNQKRAAELLGLTYHQFRGLYRKYRDEVARFPQGDSMFP